MNNSWKNNYLRYRSYFMSIAQQYKDREDLKAYLEILLSLVTISIFAVFALKPTLITIAELIKDIEAKRETLALLDTKSRDVAQAESVYNREKANIDLLDQAVPKTPAPEDYARQIEGLTTKNQVQLTGFRIGQSILSGKQEELGNTLAGEIPDTPKISGNDLTFAVSVTVTPDNYSALYSFLSDLESLRRPLRIRSAVFSVGRDVDNQEKILMLVDGVIPYLKGT